MAKTRPADVFLLSCPRTLSNLLVKLLSEQTGWEQSGYHLHDAFQYGLDNLTDQKGLEEPAAEERVQEYLAMMRDGYQQLLSARETAHEAGHSLFLKSHIGEIVNPSPFFGGISSSINAPAFTALQPQATSSSLARTNPTMLPDKILLSFVPVFLIRHPALVVDSYHRAKGFLSAAKLRQSQVAHSTGLQLTRALFEWYSTASTAAAEGKGRPILVDADDVLEGDTVQRLARAVGMDPDQILGRWETRSTDELEPGNKRFVTGLWCSTGIDRSKSSKGLNLKDKFEAWNELYGEEVGRALADLTSRHMSDYEWLKSRKF
ncbi:hypothetical protein PWT90_08909 [Aphanocladium album]|nr:hypothetical protein PWT90_08909 [Aphanocladium album]